MADKKGKEEYQLPEEEDLESHHEEETQFIEKPQRVPFSIKEILLSRKVLVPILIILGVYSIYKFMEFRDRQQLKMQQPEVTEKETAPATPLPITPKEEPIKAQPALPAVSETQTPVVAQEQMNKNQAQVDSLGTQMNQLQLTQTQMNSELTELSESVKTLTAKLDQQPKSTVVVTEEPQQPRLMRKKKIKRYHGSRRARGARGVSYHIRAVVPGRAWLVSSSGRLFTVRVGDRIVGFGIVEEIDVVRGVVIMSSGREITYGKYDS